MWSWLLPTDVASPCVHCFREAGIYVYTCAAFLYRMRISSVRACTNLFKFCVSSRFNAPANHASPCAPFTCEVRPLYLSVEGSLC